MTRSSAAGVLVEVLLILLGLGVILGGTTGTAFYSMAFWTLLALVHVAVILWGAWRHRLVPDRQTTGEPAPALGPWMVSLLGWTLMIAAFMGLFGGLIGLSVPRGFVADLPEILGTDRETALRAARVVFNVITVLMALLGWSLLHLGYARHYERLDHLHGPVIEFPGTSEPGSIDYVYFAMTVGTTFATSDVTVTARRLRWTVTVHSVLAFFYNAVVMAVAFKILPDQ